MRGFTLIEVIIYIALFGILMAGAVVATYQLIDGGARNQRDVTIQEEGTFLIRKINWTLTSVASVSVSPEGTALSVQKLAGPGFAASDNPLVFAQAGSALSLSRGSSAPVLLSGDAFVVSNVVFTAAANAIGSSTSVTASFNLNGVPFVYQTYLR